MKYLVFGGDTYYPQGGWKDFLGTAETLTDALRLALKRGTDWYQIVDAETLKPVEYGDRYDTDKGDRR